MLNQLNIDTDKALAVATVVAFLLTITVYAGMIYSGQAASHGVPVASNESPSMNARLLTYQGEIKPYTPEQGRPVSDFKPGTEVAKKRAQELQYLTNQHILRFDDRVKSLISVQVESKTEAVIAVSLGDNGEIKDSVLYRSTGSPELDSQIRTALSSIKRVSVPQDQVAKRRFTQFTTSIEFAPDSST